MKEFGRAHVSDVNVASPHCDHLLLVFEFAVEG